MAQPLTYNQTASLYLKAIGAPDTPAMRRVMIAWMMSEGGYGGRKTADNNPLNIAGYNGPCGTNQSGTHDFPIFCTPEQGASAFAQRIGSSSHGYPKIVAGFKSGDPTKTLEAIIGSGWVTGDQGLKQYQYTKNGAHYNSLVINYNALGNPDISYKDIAPFVQVQGTAKAGGGGSDPVTTAGQSLTVPFGSYFRLTRKLTGDTPFTDQLLGDWLDGVLWIHFLTGNGGKTPDAAAEAQIKAQATAAVAQYKGKPISTMPDNITINFDQKTTTTQTDPVTAVANSISQAAQQFGVILDPKNWIKILAILAGGTFVLVGGWFVLKDMKELDEYNTPPGLPQPPIIIRGIR